MSIQKRQAETTFEIFKTLVGEGKADVRPGDIATVMRNRNSPMGVWEIRGLLSELADQGLITVNPETGAWMLAEATDTNDAKQADAG